MKRGRRSCDQIKVFNIVNWPWGSWTRKPCNIESIEHILPRFASRRSFRCASGMLLIGARVQLVGRWIAVNLLRCSARLCSSVCVNLRSFWLVHSFQLSSSFRSFVFQSMARNTRALLVSHLQKACVCACLPLEHNMQNVAGNDTVNLEGLLSNGPICHRMSLCCFLVYFVHTLHPVFLLACVHLSVVVKIVNYWSSEIE